MTRPARESSTGGAAVQVVPLLAKAFMRRFQREEIAGVGRLIDSQVYRPAVFGTIITTPKPSASEAPMARVAAQRISAGRSLRSGVA